MISADMLPPAFVCEAPMQSRNVIAWGDDGAMEALKAGFESRGWTWATMLLGEKTQALVLTPPSGFDDKGLCALANEINAGRFGQLNAGFATFGDPKESSHGSDER